MKKMKPIVVYDFERLMPPDARSFVRTYLESPPPRAPPYPFVEFRLVDSFFHNRHTGKDDDDDVNDDDNDAKRVVLYVLLGIRPGSYVNAISSRVDGGGTTSSTLPPTTNEDDQRSDAACFPDSMICRVPREYGLSITFRNLVSVMPDFQSRGIRRRLQHRFPRVRHFRLIWFNANNWVAPPLVSRMDVDSYREYVTAHEMGHALGFWRHEHACRPDGRVSIMDQQTMGTFTCRPHRAGLPLTREDQKMIQYAFEHDILRYSTKIK